MSNYNVRISGNQDYNATLTGTVAPRKFIQLTDVNMIGVQDRNLVIYDEESKTFIPISGEDYLKRNMPDEVLTLYVGKHGDDTNSGRTIEEAKLTIEAAVSIATEGTVIRISPGTYEINNPVTLPDQVSLVGYSLREVSITCANPGDVFYVGNGNYIAEMSFVGPANDGAAIVSFDPNAVRYINQSPYVQNCTNFIPNSIGLKVDGKYAVGPIKSMVLDSYTQFNQNGIGVSITNSGYAQLVSLFTICDDIAVYCGSGGACDLTNSNSSFGNFGLIADGLSPLQYVGIVTRTEDVNSDTFDIQFENPTFNITNALYDNTTGILTAFTSTPHQFSVGMGVSLAGLGFTCDTTVGILTYPSGLKGNVFQILSVAPGRYIDAYNSIQANRREIQDKSLAEVAIQYVGYANTNFYFPGESETNARSRYYDATRLIQKNKQEIIDKSLASIAVGFSTGFKFPTDPSPYERNRYYDASRLITINKQEIVDKSLSEIAIQYTGFANTNFYFPGESETNSRSRYYDASRLIAQNKQEIVDKSLASIAVGFPTGFKFPDDPIDFERNRYYDATRLITLNKQEIVDKSLAAVAIAHSDFYFPDDTQTNIRSRYYDSYRLIQRNKDVIVGLAWSETFNAYPQFSYTEDKCRRDIGYFIDAISTDVFTGGNSYSRGFTLQYFNGVNPIGIGASEREPSVYAFTQVRELMKQAITNTLVGAAYSDLTLTPDSLTGFNTSPFSCADVQSNIDNLVGIVTVSIGAGNTSSLPLNPNQGYFDLSVGIGTTVSPGGVKCARDLSFLLEAVATDVFTGGNKYSRDFTLQYFDKNGNPISNGLIGEEIESITAFNALRDYSLKAVTNQLNYKNIGISSGPADYNVAGPDIPVLPSGNSNSCFDVQTNIINLVGIVTTIIGSGSTSSLSTFNENLGISTTNICARDLGFLVDAITTDVFTGGNKYSRDFTKQYFDINGNPISNGLIGEEIESVYAFNTLGSYLKKAITNQLNYKELNLSVGFSTYPNIGNLEPVLPSGNSGACADVQSNIDNLVGIVTTVIGTGSTSFLSTFSENLGISTTNTCARDISFLVEALATDVFTGGNKYSRDFTKQYFDASNNFVFLDGESEESVVAFNSVSKYAKRAVTNQLNYKELNIFSGPANYGGGGIIPVLPSGNSNSCADVQSNIDNLVGIVTTVIGTGSTSFLTTFNENLGISTSNICARDIGFFIDAISTDVFTGGNRYSRDFTKQYFDSNNNLIYLNGENIQSIYAFNTAGEYAKKAITNQLNYKELNLSVGFSTYPNIGSLQPVLPSGNSASCADVQSNIDNLVGIVTTVIGIGTNGNIQYLNTFTENTGTFTEGASKCLRDIGYIVDAVSNDVKDYTSRNTITATKAYFKTDGTLISNGIANEIEQTIVAFNKARDLMNLALTNNLNNKNPSLAIDPVTGSNTSPESCSNVQSFVNNLTGIITTTLNVGDLNISPLPPVSIGSTEFSAYVGISTLAHYYNSGGTVNLNIVRPFDGQVIYFNQIFYSVSRIRLIDGGSGYTTPPRITIEPPSTPWGIPAQAVPTIRNGRVIEIDLVSSGRGYTSMPSITIDAPDVGINRAVISLEIIPNYYAVQRASAISSGISTVTISENIPYSITEGTPVYFYKQSRVLATGQSLEYVGSGTDITQAIPFIGGVPIQENETESRNGGLVVYTSTDQTGNFRIGDGVVINQQTGTVSGTAYSKSLFSQLTPYILALGGE
jgi:hypothetical protein